MEQDRLPLSRGDVFTIHAGDVPKDNAPDYPTSAPQSKGNSAELFRSTQYTVLEPSKLRRAVTFIHGAIKARKVGADSGAPR